MKKNYIVPQQINIELDTDNVMLQQSGFGIQPGNADSGYTPNDGNNGNNDSRNSLWEEW